MRESKAEALLKEICMKMCPFAAFAWGSDVLWRVELAVGNIEQFGYSPEECRDPAFSYADLIHPDDLPRIESLISHYESACPESYRLEYRLRTKWNEYRWVEERRSLLKDEKGEPLGYWGLVMDIDDRKHLEEALINDKIQLEKLFHYYPSPMALESHSFAVLKVNEAFTNLFGYTNEEAVGRTLNELVVPGDLLEEGLSIDIQSREGVIRDFRTFRQCKDGRRVAVSMTVQPIEIIPGHQIFCTVYEDITEKVKAEEDLRVATERLVLAVEWDKSAIWDWDIPKKKVYRSPMWGTILGYDPEELPSDYKTWEELIHPEDRDRVLELIEKILTGESLTYEAEYRLHSQSGAWVWVHDRGKVVKTDLQGRPLRVLGNFKDVTDRKQFEIQQNRLIRDLQEEATTDRLTGILNRSSIEKRLQLEAERANQTKTPLSLVMFDLDNLKQINDSYGHPEGDNVLSWLGEVLKKHTRSSDYAGRWGGDEFLIVVPGPSTQAYLLAEKLRCQIQKSMQERRYPLTASFGVAQYRFGEPVFETARRADAALYQAKKRGKNRVEI